MQPAPSRRDDEAVAANIRRSFAPAPRPMYVLYRNPRPDSPFARGAPFRLVSSGPDHELYRLERDVDRPAAPR